MNVCPKAKEVIITVFVVVLLTMTGCSRNDDPPTMQHYRLEMKGILTDLNQTDEKIGELLGAGDNDAVNKQVKKAYEKSKTWVKKAKNIKLPLDITENDSMKQQHMQIIAYIEKYSQVYDLTNQYNLSKNKETFNKSQKLIIGAMENYDLSMQLFDNIMASDENGNSAE